MAHIVIELVHVYTQINPNALDSGKNFKMQFIFQVYMYVFNYFYLERMFHYFEHVSFAKFDRYYVTNLTCDSFITC